MQRKAQQAVAPVAPTRIAYSLSCRNPRPGIDESGGIHDGTSIFGTCTREGAPSGELTPTSCQCVLFTQPAPVRCGAETNLISETPKRSVPQAVQWLCPETQSRQPPHDGPEPCAGGRLHRHRAAVCGGSARASGRAAAGMGGAVPMSLSTVIMAGPLRRSEDPGCARNTAKRIPPGRSRRDI